MTLPHEAYVINSFIVGGPTSCLIHKWVNYRGSKRVVYVMMECPGLNEFTFDISRNVCLIRGAEVEEDMEGIVLKHKRTYFLSLKFDCGCCHFDSQATKKQDQVLQNGLLLLKLRVSSNHPLWIINFRNFFQLNENC